jgi:hypothetical protein
VLQSCGFGFGFQPLFCRLLCQALRFCLLNLRLGGSLRGEARQLLLGGRNIYAGGWNETMTSPFSEPYV